MNIRRSGLPQVEELGNLLPLDIAETQGIADQTHVQLFSRDIQGVPSTIAGAVYNYYGPRVPRLGYYLLTSGDPVAGSERQLRPSLTTTPARG